MGDRTPQHLTDASPEPAARAAPTWWRSPTAWVLIAANLLPLYGVLVLGWAEFPVLVLFWLENVVIGVLNVLRILVARPGRYTGRPPRLFLAAIFCVHYGLFTAAHGLLIFTLFGDPSYRVLLDGLWTIDAARAVIEESALWPALAALVTSHLFSFVFNYLGHGEYRDANPKALMGTPYGRVIVLQVTIIFGAILIRKLHSPLWALLLLVAFKIALDLRAHVREHRRSQAKMAYTAA